MSRNLPGQSRYETFVARQSIAIASAAIVLNPPWKGVNAIPRNRDTAATFGDDRLWMPEARPYAGNGYGSGCLSRSGLVSVKAVAKDGANARR